MSGRRRINVRIVGRDLRVSGWGSRELLTEVCGRPPMYSRADRAWCAMVWRLPDLEALATLRGWDVVVEGDPPAPVAAPVVWPKPAAGAASHPVADVDRGVDQDQLW